MEILQMNRNYILRLNYIQQRCIRQPNYKNNNEQTFNFNLANFGHPWVNTLKIMVNKAQSIESFVAADVFIRNKLFTFFFNR